jgi:hypothetical protein
MQFHRKGNTDNSFGVTENWEDEINAPGAGQMQYVKQLMLGRSYFDRMPDQSLVINNGEKYERVIATRATTYAMFYVYTGRTFKVAMNKLNFKPTKATWFSPTDSQVIPVSGYKYETVKSFDPPGEKENGNDWVLILEK